MTTHHDIYGLPIPNETSLLKHLDTPGESVKITGQLIGASTSALNSTLLHLLAALVEFVLFGCVSTVHRQNFNQRKKPFLTQSSTELTSWSFIQNSSDISFCCQQVKTDRFDCGTLKRKHASLSSRTMSIKFSRLILTSLAATLFLLEWITA